MDELIQWVAQNTGISHEQAKMAVTPVIGFLKGKLPVDGENRPAPDAKRSAAHHFGR